jgi:hypothetical protein
MSEESGVQCRGVARRGLIRRMALLGLGGVIVTGGLALGSADQAKAQGYMPGHWRWNGNNYVWFPGGYIPRGPRYARFVPGHWAMRYGNWVWIPQHWN